MVSGSRFMISGSECRVHYQGFRIREVSQVVAPLHDAGFRVQNSVLRV